MCEGASNTNKFENFKCLIKISKISAFLAAYFGQNQRPRPLFQMCMDLIFIGKKPNGIYLYDLSKNLTF